MGKVKKFGAISTLIFRRNSHQKKVPPAPLGLIYSSLIHPDNNAETVNFSDSSILTRLALQMEYILRLMKIVSSMGQKLVPIGIAFN